MEESIKQWATTFRGILLNAELADPNLGKLINEDVIVRFMQSQEGGLPVLTTLDRESLAALVNRFEMWLSGPEGRDAFHTEVWMHLTDDAKNDFLAAIGSTITAADSKKEINSELVDYFTCAFKAMIKKIKDADEDELDIALKMITKDFDDWRKAFVANNTESFGITVETGDLEEALKLARELKSYLGSTAAFEGMNTMWVKSLKKKRIRLETKKT